MRSCARPMLTLRPLQDLYDCRGKGRGGIGGAFLGPSRAVRPLRCQTAQRHCDLTSHKPRFTLCQNASRAEEWRSEGVEVMFWLKPRADRNMNSRQASGAKRCRIC